MSIKFNEEQIEDYVFNNIGILGFEDEIKKYRQFPINPYGIIDIVTMSSSEDGLDIYIIELKAEPLKINHITQILKYKTGMKYLVEKYFSRYNINIELILFTMPTKENSDGLYLFNELREQIDFYEYTVNLKHGIEIDKSHHHWWVSDKFRSSTINKIGKEIKIHVEDSLYFEAEKCFVTGELISNFHNIKEKIKIKKIIKDMQIKRNQGLA